MAASAGGDNLKKKSAPSSYSSWSGRGQEGGGVGAEGVAGSVRSPLES